jgi:hypothetical protein
LAYQERTARQKGPSSARPAGRRRRGLGQAGGRLPAGARWATGGTAQLRFAQSFAQIVSVLMRDPGDRSLAIADLEWLVLPAVAAGQFRLAHAPMPAEGMPAEGMPAVSPSASPGASKSGAVTNDSAPVLASIVNRPASSPPTML